MPPTQPAEKKPTKDQVIIDIRSELEKANALIAQLQEGTIVETIRVPEGMVVQLVIKPSNGDVVPEVVKDAFASLGYEIVENFSEVDVEPTPALTAERIAEAESHIREKKIAEIIDNGGKDLADDADRFGWKGEENWPIFIGYPYLGILASMPWTLIRVRDDAETHCTVFVRG